MYHVYSKTQGHAVLPVKLFACHLQQIHEKVFNALTLLFTTISKSVIALLSVHVFHLFIHSHNSMLSYCDIYYVLMTVTGL